MEKVPFSKIKKGDFFRVDGKDLLQRFKGADFGQYVTGPHIGNTRADLCPNDLVTPVNARIVIDE
jgi:hypothetical protein